MIAGLLRVLYRKAHLGESSLGSAIVATEFPVKAVLSWGLVMWLFRHHPGDLQPSLRASMNYLYRDSEYWTSLRDFLFVNKLQN